MQFTPGLYRQPVTPVRPSGFLARGDIPVLGYLFKSNQKVSNRSELLVFITPRIVADSLTLR